MLPKWHSHWNKRPFHCGITFDQLCTKSCACYLIVTDINRMLRAYLLPNSLDQCSNILNVMICNWKKWLLAWSQPVSQNRFEINRQKNKDASMVYQANFISFLYWKLYFVNYIFRWIYSNSMPKSKFHCIKAVNRSSTVCSVISV